jgi:hypothetical protein
MKLRVIALLSAVGLGALSLASAPASAEGGKPAAAKAKPVQGKAGELIKKVRLQPKGLEWGMSAKRVSDLYKRVFDREFLPLYKKAEPGVEMKALDAELEDRKGLLLRSKVDFGKLPTGIDSTPLKGEYSYNNNESMTRITLRNGTTRNFFFFDDKLWKVYDEHPLKKGGKFGETFDEAIVYLGKLLHAVPKISEADFKTTFFKEGTWANGDLVIRAVDRGNVLGLVYADRSVQDRLSNYRKTKPQEEVGVDSDVKSILRKDEVAGPPKPEPMGTKKKKPNKTDDSE